MNVIDIRTLILEQVIFYVLCTLVIVLLWQQYHRRFAGLGFWLVGFILQVAGELLLLGRSAPLWLSVVVSNAFILGGIILFFIGLALFVEKPSRQYHNAVIFTVVVLVHTYFTYFQPNLAIRKINLSTGVLILSLQIVWLMVKRVQKEQRPFTRWTGIVFVGFALVSVVRIVSNVFTPGGNDFIRETGVFDAMLISIYQVLFFGLTFSLFWMILGRLSFENQQQQDALQKNEARYRNLVEFSPDAVYVYQGGKFVFVNSAGVELVGAEVPEDLLGKDVLDFVHPDFQERSRERIASVSTHGDTAPLIHTKLMHLDGTAIDVELTTARFEYEGKLALYTIVRDITARKKAEDVLHLRLELIDFSVDHTLNELMTYALDEIGEITQSPIGFYHFVEEDQVTLSLQAWSTSTTQVFCQAEGVGLHYGIDKAGVWVDCVHQRRPVIHNDYASLPHRKGLPPGHAPVKRELVVPTMRKGKIVSILGVGNKSSNYDEADIELVAYVADVIWDIVARKRIETQLLEYQQQLEAQNLELMKFSLAIEQSGNSVIVTDAKGLIEYVNPRYEETSGYKLNEVVGTPPRILNPQVLDEAFFRKIWETINDGEIWRGEFHNQRKDGSAYWESITIAPVQDVSGNTKNFISIKEDITARKEMEAELNLLATTDTMTGVFNRHQITSLAEQELKRAHRYGHTTSLIMLDMDYLKQINDRHGHSAGDLAIKRTAQVLKDSLRDADILGRYGGDEFIIVLPETDGGKALLLAERLRTVVEGISLRYGNETFKLSISLGLACVEPDQDGAVLDFSAVTRLADEALYAAKAAGRNCVWVR